MTDNSVLTDEVRADLKAKAEKATPGPWFALGPKGSESPGGGCVTTADNYFDGQTLFGVWSYSAGLSFDQARENGRFIAAANPSVILSLLTALEEAEGREHRVCDGCGSSRSIADLKAAGAISCCPERKMLTAKEWAARAEKAEQQVAAQRETLVLVQMSLDALGGDEADVVMPIVESAVAAALSLPVLSPVTEEAK